MPPFYAIHNLSSNVFIFTFCLMFVSYFASFFSANLTSTTVDLLNVCPAPYVSQYHYHDTRW